MLLGPRNQATARRQLAQRARSVCHHLMTQSKSAVAQLGSCMSIRDNDDLTRCLHGTDVMLSPMSCSTLGLDNNIHVLQRLALARLVFPGAIIPVDEIIAVSAIDTTINRGNNMAQWLESNNFPAAASGSRAFLEHAHRLMSRALKSDTTTVIDIMETVDNTTVGLVTQPGSMMFTVVPLQFPESNAAQPRGLLPVTATISLDRLMNMPAGLHPSAMLALQRYFPDGFANAMETFQGFSAFYSYIRDVKLGNRQPAVLPFTTSSMSNVKGVLLLDSLSDVPTIIAMLAATDDSIGPCFSNVNIEAACHNKPFGRVDPYFVPAALPSVPYADMQTIESLAREGVPLAQQLMPACPPNHRDLLLHYTHLPAQQQMASMAGVLAARSNLTTLLNNPNSFFPGMNLTGSIDEIELAANTDDSDSDSNGEQSTCSSGAAAKLPAMAAAFMATNPELTPEIAGMAAAAALFVKLEDTPTLDSHKRRRN